MLPGHGTVWAWHGCCTRQLGHKGAGGPWLGRGGGECGCRDWRKMQENAAKNAIGNAVLLEWCMPPKTPMFIKTHVDLLTPSLHQCEDYGPGSTCKPW